MPTYYVLHAKVRNMDDDVAFKVFSGLGCGGPEAHAHLCVDQMMAGKYASVAKLEARTLGEVYQRTNTIESPWVHGPGITRLVPETGLRSTSVGDILVAQEQGHATLHVVSGCGFTDVTQYFAKGGAAATVEAAHG